MPTLEFLWDSREIALFKERGNKPAITKAIFRALSKSGNDALRGMKTHARRLVQEKKRFKVAQINKGLPLDFAHGQTIDTLEWRMRVSGAAQPVAGFVVRQTKKGVTARINAGRLSFIKGAFIAQVGSHKGVFQRLTHARLPIKQDFTTRLSDVFTNTGFLQLVGNNGQFRFVSNFRRLLPLELAKVVKSE